MVEAGVLVEALSRGLPGDRIVADPDVLAALSHDEAEWAPAGKAAAAVRARSEAEVQHVVRTCAGLGAPVVPRGAGTGLSGGANAVSGCVILDLSRMNRVLEIDRDNLVAVVQPGAVNDDVKAAVAALSHDEAEWAPAGPAAAAVRARSEAEVQHVVRTCAELRVPVVPRGAGTGLSGGANAVRGCVVLDLAQMNQVLEIDPDNLVAVVQPGAVNDDVKAAVAEHGLWYPPDPASAPWSTIGGNVATNAGGLC